jgi:hypothetical protein
MTIATAAAAAFLVALAAAVASCRRG